MKITTITQSVKDTYQKKFALLSVEQRKKIASYLYIALTLFTISFFGLFAIAPTLTTVSNLQKQYEDNKLVYDALNKKLTNLGLLDFQYRQIQDSLAGIYDAIPRSPQMPKATRQLENIASASNVTIKKLSFGTIELFPNGNNEQIYSFNFTTSISGTSDSVNNFIRNIIAFDRIVGIERISTGKNEENQYEAQIVGRIYFSTN